VKLIIRSIILIFCFFSQIIYANLVQDKIINLSVPDYTKKTATEWHGVYQKPSQILSSNNNQNWDQYCPKCTLLNQSLCEKYQCSEANINSDKAYQGIQVASDQWIRLANNVALEAVKHGGGPFGAVIVQVDNKTGKVLRYWIGYDHSANEHDPTAHAEISAIREAAKQLGVDNLGEIHREQSKLSQNGELSHCIIYSSTEPCEMCLAAIYWAGIREVVFAATRYDAAVPGVDFSDKLIHEESTKSYQDRQVVTIRQAITSNSLDAFNYYKRHGEIKRYGNVSD